MKITSPLPFAVLLVLIALSSCRKAPWCEDPELSWKKGEYMDVHPKLRMDGFYYGPASEPAYDGTIIHQAIIFYQNGVLIDAGSTEFDNLQSYVETLNASIIEVKYAWGVSSMQDTAIKFEGWSPRMCSYVVVHQRGSILNDTTFVITKGTIRNKNETTDVREVNEVYHFMHTNVKPDSTNRYIQ